MLARSIPLPQRFARWQVWNRSGAQLAGGIVLGAILPSTIAAIVAPELLALDLFPLSFLANLTAITLGFWLFRNLIAFPGIRASYYVLPVFSSTFAAVFAVLFLLRLDYSRPLLLAGFGAALIWHYTVYFMLQRRQRLTIAVVPLGRVASLYGIASIDWALLDQPRMPPDCATLAADFDHDLGPDWLSFLAECVLAGVSVVHYKQLRQSLTGQVQMEHLSENAFGSLVPNSTYLAVKQACDILIACAVLPFALLPMIGVALLIKLGSAGPVFFCQTRIGYRGHPFEMWKFRTMRGCPPPVPDDPEGLRLAITSEGDARVTPIGRVLRRTRMDELPQLLNILRGEMSWIGPRPEAAVLARWYQAELPFYRYRHVVRPGISGWAQVNQGHVAELDEVLKKLGYDFFYISRFTFWIDMLIVVRTIKTIVTGFGSR